MFVLDIISVLYEQIASLPSLYYGGKQAHKGPNMQPSMNVRNLPSSYIREILNAATSPGCISLAGGLPSEAQFPFAALEAIFDDLSKKVKDYSSLFQYGLTQGYPPLIQYLSETYQIPGDHSLMVTAGSQQAIDVVARCYIDAGDLVLMEAPSYLGAIQIFSLSQARIRTVQQNLNGPDPAQVEQAFKTEKYKIFYAVPDFHNPSGCCWSLDVRKAIAALCERYGVLFVEDAPYREIRFSGRPQPLVSEFCPNYSVVLKSFSKMTIPGLRLGALMGPKTLMEPMARAKQAMDLHTNLPAQHILLKLLSDGHYQQHLDGLKAVYLKRYTALCQWLDTYITEFGRYHLVEGGMFIWLELKSINTDLLAQKSLENGVAVVPSSVFYIAGEKNNSALRLNFSHSSEEKIEVAVARLRSSIMAL